MANLDRVVNHQRLLILPRVRVWGLASWALREAVLRLPEDWPHPRQVSPASVHVSGFRTARHLLSRRGLAVAEDWQPRLKAVPRRKLGRWGDLPIPTNADWADMEHARGNHPDGRAQRRIRHMGRAWARRPGAMIPEVFPAEAERKAAYRLLSHGQVGMEHLPASHQQALAERCTLETRALTVQDTSSLNHGSHGATEGLARIGRNGRATANGPRIQVGLAVTEAGRPLGLFAPNADDRGKLDNESRRWLQGMDRAREVAEACPNTRVITVCDQEGDFRELLLKAESERQGLRVRARRHHARCIVFRDQLLDLWEWMALRLPLERRTLKCSARRAADAITARHLFDLARRAREHPEHTARALASQDEIGTLRRMLEELGTPWARSPPRQNPDTRTFVIGPGRIVGFQPSKRQPLPGVQKVWEGDRTLKLVCRGVQLARNSTPAVTDSSVGE